MVVAPPVVQIDMDVVPLISYAMAHNRIPIVQRISVCAPEHDVVGATLTISMADAESAVSTPFETIVDLAAGQDTILADVKLLADPAAMLQVEEQRPARITVRVLDGDDVLGEAVKDLQLLAARQWLAQPLQLALEMLPAFVMPNDPTVAELLSEAGTVLARKTGNPSTQGYQSGAERVDEIVEALADAMRDRKIRYSNPPASWGDIGQKVRTPAEVLDGRVGTCLDTVVVLAAALEQAGIFPLMVDGHAFLGYWRDEALGLPSTVETEVDQLVNQIDLRNMRLVETTMLTASAEAFRVDELHTQPYGAWLARGTDKVLAAVDVHTARRNGIYPLPARRTTSAGVHVVEYVPAVHSGGPATAVAGQLSHAKASVRRPPYRRASSSGRTPCST